MALLLQDAVAGGAGSDLAGLVFLAVVQGLTEFLPISSSGHLVLSQEVMGYETAGVALEVALHVGTLLAVLLVYRADLVALLRGALGGPGLREIGLIVVGTIPAGLVGVLLGDVLEELFTARVAAWGLFATAAILLGGEFVRRRQRAAVEPGNDGGAAGDPVPGAKRIPSVPQALLIGLAQAGAIVPGVSRSGSTIAMGLACGLAPAAAARFSFLLAIPAILGAAVLALPDLDAATLEGSSLAVAVVVAAVVGFGALKLLLAFLGRGAFAWFALYCAALGVTALTLL